MTDAERYYNTLTGLHNAAPPPFNPDYDPKAHKRYERVTKSMVDDGYYKNHTREECNQEWRKRYELFKKEEA